jgi:hypothetical protein
MKMAVKYQLVFQSKFQELMDQFALASALLTARQTECFVPENGELMDV